MIEKLEPEIENDDLKARLEESENRNRQLEESVRDLELQLATAKSTVDLIVNSRSWKVLSAYRSLKAVLARHIKGSRVARLPRRLYSFFEYERWIRRCESAQWDSQKVMLEIDTFTYAPVISILMPAYNTPPKCLVKAITSVRTQMYRNWELCICDDGSTDAGCRKMIEKFTNEDQRIKAVFLGQNEGISAASNRALALATGEFVGLLDHDDELSPYALYEVVKLLQSHPTADMIYSDEDKLLPNGRRAMPFFKPDWSPEYFLSCMYTCHLGVYRKRLVDEIGGFRVGFEGSQDYDLVLRISERTRNIVHIPKILYHWRMTANSTAASSSAKDYTTERGLRALQEHMLRIGMPGDVYSANAPNRYRVRPSIIGNPLVSIIIPTKDSVRILRRCVDSIERKTAYKNYEVLIVDNNSVDPETHKFFKETRHRVIEIHEPFNFSRINNVAAQHANGDFLLFLNNDTEIVSEEWLTSMLEICQLREVGIVGAKLYYPNGKIQHAGIILGIRGVAGHSHRYSKGVDTGYFGSLICLRNYSAVTAACLMIRKEVFDSVGGFDEKLKVAFNDVDLCIRVRNQGLRIVWTPYAEVRHYESATRGYSLDMTEVEFMKRRWGNTLLNDPYYNPNLTLKEEDFSLRI